MRSSSTRSSLRSPRGSTPSSSLDGTLDANLQAVLREVRALALSTPPTAERRLSKRTSLRAYLSRRIGTASLAPWVLGRCL